MKQIICCAAFAMLAVTAFGQNLSIARERARSVSGQSTARQGAPPPRAAATPTAAAPMALNPAANAQSNAMRQAITKLQSDLSVIRTNSTASQKQTLIADLNAVAFGSAKPSQDAVNKLAADLSSALAGKNLSASDSARLAQDIFTMFNSAAVSLARKQEITQEVDSLLSSPAPQNGGANVVADLELVALEVQGPAK